MHIDRARFLLLTASLAGGGCSSNPPGDPATPPPPADTGQQVAAPDDTPPPEATVAVDPPETTTSADPARDDPPPPPQTGVCDNDTGTVPACSVSAPPGPHCESFSDTKAACKSYKGGLRGAIAAKAVACINAVSGTQAVCDWDVSAKCGVQAIRTACIQPSTFNQCSPVVSQCAAYNWNKLSLDDCQRLLSSVKDGKRQRMITCMTEGCSIDSCIWELR